VGTDLSGTNTHPSPESIERRIVELESKSSYQELAILDMSKVLMEQDARIDRLEALLRALSDKVQELSGGGRPSLPANERPPHY